MISKIKNQMKTNRNLKKLQQRNQALTNKKMDQRK